MTVRNYGTCASCIVRAYTMYQLSSMKSTTANGSPRCRLGKGILRWLIVSIALILTSFIFALHFRPFNIVYTTVVDTEHEGAGDDGDEVMFHKDRTLTDSSGGYILAVHYSDQLTGSAANIFSLQCWASSLKANVRVVEPFIHYGSLLGVSLEPSPNKVNNTILITDDNKEIRMTDEENKVKLSDIFDADFWSNQAKMYRYAPLVSWKEFIHNAPKRLILVDKSCNNPALKCMQCTNTFSQSILFHDSAIKFANFVGFEIVSKVCYDLKVYSPSEFVEKVYGKYDPKDTVVIFNHWGGIHTGEFEYRIPIMLDPSSNQCDRIHNFFFVTNSMRIRRESARYVAKYLPKAKEEGYISVMVRMEHLSLNLGLRKFSKKEQLELMFTCVNNIVTEVTTVKNKLNISSVFLSTDSGKYGSIYLRKSSNSRLDNEVLNSGLDYLYKKLFGNSIRYTEDMEKIENITSSKTPGYIAMLQRDLVASANSLILAGGGYFQHKTSQLYDHYHLSTPRHIIKVNQCQ